MALVNNFGIIPPSMPIELSELLVFLNAKNLASCERVSKAWREYLLRNRDLWERLCKLHSIPNGIDLYPKSRACALVGKVTLNTFIAMGHKECGTVYNLKWEYEAPELFVYVSISNKACRKQCRGIGMKERGSWQLGYSRLPDGYFPRSLPLQFFYREDGQFKKERIESILSMKDNL